MKSAKLLPDAVVPQWRLLLWLKATLTLRRFGRDRVKLASVLLMVVAFAPLSLGIAWAVMTFAREAPDVRPFLTNGVLAGVYILWLSAPLLGFAMNDSYDPTRLFTYPVSYRNIFGCAVLGGVLDMSTVLMLPVLAALIVASSNTPLAAIASIVVVLMFLFHTLAVSQCIVLALIGLLKSRRFRDLTIVMLPLIGTCFYIAQRAAITTTGAGDWSRILHSPVLTVFSYLPCGWTARALNSAAAGHRGETAVWFLALAAVTALVVAGAGGIMRGLYFGERGTAAAGAIPAHAGAERLSERPSRLPSQLLAIVTKERRYLVRDPQYKALLVQMIYTMVVMAMPWVSGHGRGGFGPLVPQFLRPLLPFLAATFVTSIFLPLTFNILGGEGRAITVLLPMPVAGKTIVLAKNMVHAAVMAPLPLVVVVAGCLLAHKPELIGIGVFWVAIDIATILGAGNIASMLLPHRLTLRGSGGYQRAGCGYMFLQLAIYASGVVIMLIPASAIAVALWISQPLLSAALYAVAAVIATVCYIAGLLIGSRLLEDRQPEIIASLAPAE